MLCWVWVILYITFDIWFENIKLLFIVGACYCSGKVTNAGLVRNKWFLGVQLTFVKLRYGITKPRRVHVYSWHRSLCLKTLIFIALDVPGNPWEYLIYSVVERKCKKIYLLHRKKNTLTLVRNCSLYNKRKAKYYRWLETV